MRGEVRRPDVLARNLGASRFQHAEARRERIARYITLRNDGHGPEQASERVGVDPGKRTAAEYEIAFRRSARGG